MGATDFVTGVIRTPSLRDAYDAAVRDAIAERGHDPYNGTISTTGGYHQAVRTPMTVSGANFVAQLGWEQAEKWGAAEAVPVAEDSHFTFTKVKLTLELPVADEYGNPTSEYDLREAAIKKAVKKYGETLHAVEVTPKVKTKVIVENATGRAVTKYELTGRGSAPLFDTKAQAVAAAKKSVAEGNWHTELTVRAVKVYTDTGSTAATVIKKVTAEAKAAVTVTLATPKKPYDTPITGWVFYGIAAI